jgi:nucleoside-diphosphate-sugar epimerase
LLLASTRYQSRFTVSAFALIVFMGNPVPVRRWNERLRSIGEAKNARKPAALDVPGCATDSAGMSTVLVFGASGAIGHFLLPRLAPDHCILPVSRSPRPGWVRADLADVSAEWPDAEIALSLGPLDAFAAWLDRNGCHGLRRVVAMSSMSAESKCASPDPAERALAERLRSAEGTLMRVASARDIAWTIFRPTLIYGAGSDRSLAPIARFARRWRLLPIPFPAGGLRQPVHARDLAEAVLAVLANPATFGKTYELGGGERLRFDAMLWRLQRAAPGFVLPVPVPLPALRLLARLRPGIRVTPGSLRRLRQQLLADHTAATRDFGYAPAAFHATEVLPGTE